MQLLSRLFNFQVCTAPIRDDNVPGQWIWTQCVHACHGSAGVARSASLRRGAEGRGSKIPRTNCTVVRWVPWPLSRPRLREREVRWVFFFGVGGGGSVRLHKQLCTLLIYQTRTNSWKLKLSQTKDWIIKILVWQGNIPGGPPKNRTVDFSGLCSDTYNS